MDRGKVHWLSFICVLSIISQPLQLENTRQILAHNTSIISVSYTHLQGDKGVTFLSGTPISNSMVELYLILRYLRPNKLKELGLNTFDAWASIFAKRSSEIEYTVTGELKIRERFREFVNVPEMAMLYLSLIHISRKKT